MRTFADLLLEPSIVIRIPFKYPSDIQSIAIPLVLSGSNVFIHSGTGSGKTLSYSIPIVQMAKRKRKSIVVLPTKDLAEQVYHTIRMISTGMRVLKITGGVKKDVKPVKDFDILVGTVGRLSYTKIVDEVSSLVVDEVDRILGDEYMRHDYNKLSSEVNAEQVVLVSATLPSNLVFVSGAETSTVFVSGIGLTLAESNERLYSVHHCFFYVPHCLKEAALLLLVKRVRDGRGVVFVSNGITGEYLCNVINGSCFISSKMDALHRRNVLRSFHAGRFNLLISTDLTARGIDFDIDFVINYDMCDGVVFRHRSGRVGRVRDGVVWSLVCEGDLGLYGAIVDVVGRTEETAIGRIPSYLLDSYFSALPGKGAAERASRKAREFAHVRAHLRESIDIPVHPVFKEEVVTERESIIDGIAKRLRRDSCHTPGTN